jgi:hypothetical protein
MLVVASACPAVAGASTANVVTVPQGRTTAQRATYVAGAGERNAVVITAGTTQFDVVTFVDPGAVIAAGAGCTSQDPHRVVCNPRGGAFTGLLGPTVQLGDLDDSADNSGGVGAQLEGGDGNDRLTGGTDTDGLYGEAGDDVLAGGGAADILDPGPGTDDVSGAGGRDQIRGVSDGDRIDGGADLDGIDFSTRTAGVVVDLAAGAGPGGARLTSIEDVIGTAAADRISGSSAVNLLDSRGGRDELAGRGGNDLLAGGAGADTLSGGGGRDVLTPGGGRDTAGCGSGVDVVREPGPDRIAADCERVGFGLGLAGAELARRVTAGRAVARLAVSCVTGPCALRVVLSDGGREIGRSGVTRFAGGRSGTVAIALNSTGRALARPEIVAVRVIAAGVTRIYLARLR